jgi:hypothetical protein
MNLSKTASTSSPIFLAHNPIYPDTGARNLILTGMGALKLLCSYAQTA